MAHRAKSLGSAGLYDQVRLPSGVSEEEWLAVKTIEFFNELNLLVSAFQDKCTETTCPVMSAGAFTYAWADGDTVKVPTKLSAPTYMEHLLTWVDRQLADEAFFPVAPGVPFPKGYRKGLRVIYKRLFRIFAHFFHAHIQEIADCEADAHLDHSFKHFIFFVKEFGLVEEEELEPLKDYVAVCMEVRLKTPAFPVATDPSRDECDRG
jgi:MOB kinase activator 1